MIVVESNHTAVSVAPEDAASAPTEMTQVLQTLVSCHSCVLTP